MSLWGFSHKKLRNAGRFVTWSFLSGLFRPRSERFVPYSETFRTYRFIMVRCFIPIYLFLWEFFCIHSDVIINVTTKEVDELKIYKYYVYKTRYDIV